jgi:hypothetical protein
MATCTSPTVASLLSRKWISGYIFASTCLGYFYLSSFTSVFTFVITFVLEVPLVII